MVSLSADDQSRTKFHLGYSLQVPANDLARITRAMTTIVDTWTLNNIVVLLNRCDTAYDLTTLAQSPLLEEKRINTASTKTGSPSRTSQRSTRFIDEWTLRVRNYEYQCQLLASALAVRNFRDPEQVYSANLIDGDVFINSVKGDQGIPGINLTWREEWNSLIIYQLTDIVTYLGSTYVSNIPNNLGNVPTGVTWDLFVSKGDQGDQGIQGIQGIPGNAGPAGPSGINLTWQEEWDSLITYQLTDIVTYLGSTYVSNIPDNLGNVPTGVTWDLFVSKGDQGDQGLSGGLGVPDNYIFVSGVMVVGGSDLLNASFPQSYLIYEVSATAACRVRLYYNATYRTADLARPSTTLLLGDHGCYLDVLVKVSAGLVRLLAPPAVGLALSDIIYVTINNLSGVSQSITVTLRALRLGG